ncbi:MAG TPA: competence/damage-inducible protein A, partial [Baekduia sp.]|nr:competence/damage-inducible protein A [Baekduia sp.]
VDTAHNVIVGDRPEDLRGALEWMASLGMDLVVTSGGLGPTEDDLTARVVAEFQEREMHLDDALEERIWQVLEPLLKRWQGIDEDALRVSNRKQAYVPEGAIALGPVGTAPGLVVPPPASRPGPLVIVLPGPPRELQPMWPMAVGTPLFEQVAERATSYRQKMLRLFGIPESEIALTMRQARDQGVDLDALEITTCLRRGEVEIVTRWEPPQEATYHAFEGVVRERHADTLFSDDGTSVDEQVAALLQGGSRTIAVAESCTGGLLTGRLTDLAGSSAWVLGGIVAYSNAAKTHIVGVDEELVTTHGAVSTQVAEALADGARTRFGADLGIGITGIAGPGGGTEDKPVGTVCFCVSDGHARITRRAQLPGSRADVRDRSTTVALHLLRRLLRGEGDLTAGPH